MKWVAALYVDRRGPYFDHPAVDPWDEARDARLYAGPHPVIAHPPCAAWCRWAALRERDGFGKRGEDGGAFALALEAVRKWGGLLEHPRHSAAWAHFGLPEPSGPLWTSDIWGVWVCEIDQAEWGLSAHKPTWLYFVGDDPPELRATHDASEARPGTKDMHSAHRHITPTALVSQLVAASH